MPPLPQKTSLEPKIEKSLNIGDFGNFETYNNVGDNFLVHL